MTRSPADHVDPTSSDEELDGAAEMPDRAAEGPDEAVAAARGDDGTPGDAGIDRGEGLPFGAQPATRFAADVEYRGRACEHDYVVRVRHRLLDSSFTLVIDGIEHDPKVEEKARKAQEKRGPAGDVEDEGEAEEADEGENEGADPSDGAEGDGDPCAGAGEPGASPGGDSVPGDGLQFRLEEGFSTLRCTVLRRRGDGELEDGEVITIRTAGLGGAGEADVRHGLRTTLLVPPEGSPSAVRDEKRTAHPTRYALIAALAKAAKILIPLLGLGALLSGLLDPVKEWIGERIRAALEAIAPLTEPIREWVDEVTRPVREFLDTLLSPVRELIAAILRPIGDALRWLLGLLPDIGLPFSVPDWLIDVLVPVIVVVAVFVATYSGLRNRRHKLTETARGGASGRRDGRPGAEGRTRTETH